MTTVIYHSADYDGIFCREIARKFLPDAELIGWNFGDPLLSPVADRIYILDLSPDCLEPEDRLSWSKFVWIDHHATSIAKYGDQIPGYRIDGVAACRLAWQWFTCGKERGLLPAKERFIERSVMEPLAVRLAGEYDVLDKRDPNAETFQYGLRSAEVLHWEEMLRVGKVHPNLGFPVMDGYTLTLCSDGRIAQRYAQKIDADLVKHRSFRLQWEGLNWLVLNTGRFNSLTFAALDVPETGHDALMGFMFNGKVWTVSLYHAKHRTDLDLSEIAKRHGGGGHRGACGFTCERLPFDLIQKPFDSGKTPS